MDYSNNTKVIQWHKNLWKSDKTNNKFMEKLGKRTKHTFGNWQINWLSNHVSKILTQSVVDKYISFLGFFISVFFFNTEYRFKGCFLYPYNKAACLSVCVSDASPCPHFWADFKSTYIYGLPMVQGRFKNYFQGNRSRNKKKILMYTGFFKSVKNVHPTDVRPTDVHPTDVHPTDVCPTGVHRTDVCLIGVSH